jgi:hypothetical protein
MGKEIVKDLQSLNPEGNHSFEKVDCFDLSSVKSLVDKTKQDKLDYLVLSQGMATIQGFTPTTDGFDQKLSLHYYSRIV